VKKSDSFHEYLRAAAGNGGGDCDRSSVTSLVSLPEGLFEGFIRHKDGSSIDVIFQLKCIPLAGDQSLFCMWVCRDLDKARGRTGDGRPDPYWTDQIGASPEISDEVDGDQSSVPPSMSLEECLALSGVYRTCYDTLRPVGKGAFGFVRLAQRKSDKLMVAVKFLRKSGVLQDCWVKDEDMGVVAQEISLLARLNHPNIVMLLEAYENEHYFQLVMEKHGDGLDLFEFIEKCPKITEPLVSYMFRQVVAGLSYLHGKNILHRDVKDENIIMDRNFHMKLIDFGSAAYMEPGKLFHTFCGTLEYCSPEVLLGNSYPGPELEMWALGVTLYTLVFGENPFFDVEETISGHLQPPYLTSPGLMKIILWLLHPHPNSRATLKDLERDKWTNQGVDVSQFNFEAVLGYPNRLNEEEQALKVHPQNGKPHPHNEIHDLQYQLDTRLHLDPDSKSCHGNEGD
jgi:PAS domain-containing serine/threonine kinase